MSDYDEVEELLFEDPYQQAQDWVRTCVAGHSCASSEPLPDLPTRLLDVSQDSIRLVTKLKNGITHGQYIALSYCWGKIPSITKTPETLEAHEQGVQLTELPRTIRDAVLVTRRLGQKYPWVDRLCIIQGQSQEAREDWAGECKAMEAVYSNAFLTISAAAAEHPDQGFFFPRFARFKAQISEASAKTTPVIVVPRCDFRSTNLEPWFERGWTLQ
jgi:hypothetical protein